MKTIKKSLGILLVAALLFNLIAATASAAVMADRLMSIRVNALDTTVNAGDTVTLVVSLESKVEFPEWNAGEYDVGYNNNYFSIGTYAEDIITTGYGYAGMLSSYSYTDDAFATDPTASEVTNYGWNNYTHIALVDDTGGASWVNASTKVNIFAIELTVKAGTPDGTYYVGLGYSGYDNMTSYVNEKSTGSAYHGFNMGTAFGLSTDATPLYDLSEAVVAIQVGKSVSYDNVKVRWGSDASHVDLGYKATINNMTLDTNGDGTVEELNEIGVIFSKSVSSPTLASVTAGTATKVTCGSIYNNGNGTYSFRAVVNNAPINNTETIYAVMYMTLADGTTHYYSLVNAKSAQAAYNAGVAAGMPAYA